MPNSACCWGGLPGFCLERHPGLHRICSHARPAWDEGHAGGHGAPLDRLYPQPNAESPAQQLIIEPSSPLPFYLSQTDLSEYKMLSSRWRDWPFIRKACIECALQLAQTLKAPVPTKAS